MDDPKCRARMIWLGVLITALSVFFALVWYDQELKLRPDLPAFGLALVAFVAIAKP
jgi:hypothetical protein